MIEREIYYTERLHEIKLLEQQTRKRLHGLAWLRLAIFLSLFPGIFMLIPVNAFVGISVTLILLILFLWLIKRYHKLEERYNHLKSLNKLNGDELRALKNDYSAFAPGDEFINTNHPYSYDMDLYGDGSLFQFLNRTVTYYGKKALTDLLSGETLRSEDILKRQEAIKELSNVNELLQDFRAAGMEQNDNKADIELLKEWIERPVYYLSRKFYLLLARFLPIITISSIILAIILPVFRGIAVALFLLQLYFVGRRMSDTSKEHNLIGQRLAALKKYGYLLSIIEQGKFTSSELVSISAALTKGDTSASVAIKSLSKLVSAFDNRLNVLAAFFLEGLLLWDIQCMIRLEHWKTKQGRYFSQWLEVIATFDALTSLATLTFNQPEFTFPVFSKDHVLKTKKMGHALIPVGERVLNDFTINDEGEYIIITGANMAGKSTFLRTVVTNMVLAMSGAPVCAEYFSFSPILIFSSMRTSDSLNKHESYFYAELKRLKDLLERLRNGERLFIVLDEILKGTNSTDKQKGSRSALGLILKLGGTGIIATHDLELAAIEKEFPGRVRNMCFEIEIDQANISFDYKLREGITTKMNALLLMQQMGIIRD
jgi:DNA mismatch repair ATPase MutS